MDGDQLRRPLVGGRDVEWGTDHADAYALVADALNLTPTVVYRTDSDGKRIKLEAETLAANDKRTALDGVRRVGVVRPGTRRPARAGLQRPVQLDRAGPLGRLPPASPPRPVRGVRAAPPPTRRGVAAPRRSTGNVLLGHKVGAGKTATMVIAGQELRRPGQITKPLYVVPNHMLDQFAAEFAPAVPDGQGAGRHQATTCRARHGGGSSPAAPPATGTPW